MKGWKDISDQELDDLFREEAKSLKPPEPTEAQWQIVASQLSAEGLSKSAPRKWAKWLLPLLLLFIIGGVGYLTFSGSSGDVSKVENLESNNSSESIENSEKLERSSAAEANTSNEASSALEENTATTNESNLKTNINELKVVPSDLKEQTFVEQDGVVVKKKADVAKPSTQQLEEKGKVIKSNDRPISSVIAKANSTSQLQSLTANSSNESSATSFRSSQTTDDVLIKSSELNEEGSISKQLVDAANVSKLWQVNQPSKAESYIPSDLINLNANSIDYAAYAPLAFRSVSSTTSNTKENRFRKNIYLSFSYSPDFSRVLQNSFGRMGNNIGGHIEVALSPRWRIISGAISSKKFYGANSKNISWPDNWGPMPYELEGMKGSCNVIDIPLNLRFNIKGSERSTMYLVGGVSSFFLMNEKYDYLYQEGTYTDGMKKSWSGKSGFLPAGMANFAIGFETKLNETFSLQVEPFVKAPIRSFGFTDVRLSSTGVFFTAKAKIK